MNDKLINKIMLLLGICGLLGTWAIQVSQGGELKGEIRANLTAQKEQMTALSDHVTALHDKDSEHDKAISNIEGRLHGIASQVGKVPSRVAAKLQPEEPQQ